MRLLVIGSRPQAYVEAADRLGVDFDAVYDPEEAPRAPATPPGRVLWLPYMTEPERILAVPRLHEYDGVVSLVDFGALAAALAVSVLDGPGPSVAAVLRTRNKHLMRTTLRDHGFAQPAFGLLDEDVPRPDDYPVFVKPLDGTGSSGVRLVGSAGELVVVPRGRPMFWESRLPGTQYTVEGVIRGGIHDTLAITGKSVSGPPHFVVTEHETPARLDPATRDTVATYAADCLAALGVRDCTTHTEIALSDGVPMLIETHTRPAGDRVPLITRLTTGWDQYEFALALASADSPKVSAHTPHGTFARTLHFTPYDSSRGRLAAPTWLESFPEVVMHDFSRVFSSRVNSHDSRWGHDPRWGHVVIAGDDRDALAVTSRTIRQLAREGADPL